MVWFLFWDPALSFKKIVVIIDFFFFLFSLLQAVSCEFVNPAALSHIKG